MYLHINNFPTADGLSVFSRAVKDPARDTNSGMEAGPRGAEAIPWWPLVEPLSPADPVVGCGSE